MSRCWSWQGRQIGAGGDGGELIGPRDAQIGARHLDSHHSIAKVVILDERRPDQFLKLLVLEDLEPFQVGQRLGVRRGGFVGGSAKDIGRLDAGPAVLRTDHAARGQTHNHHDNHQLLLHTQ